MTELGGWHWLLDEVIDFSLQISQNLICSCLRCAFMHLSIIAFGFVAQHCRAGDAQMNSSELLGDVFAVIPFINGQLNKNLLIPGPPAYLARDDEAVSVPVSPTCCQGWGLGSSPTGGKSFLSSRGARRSLFF